MIYIFHYGTKDVLLSPFYTQEKNQNLWSFDSHAILLDPLLVCLINKYCNNYHKYHCGKGLLVLLDLLHD